MVRYPNPFEGAGGDVLPPHEHTRGKASSGAVTGLICCSLSALEANS